MVFVCVSIRTPKKVLKPWFARTVLDGNVTLGEVFAQFSTGEFDAGDPIDDEYQTTQVKINIGQHKDKLLVSSSPCESVADIVSCLGHFIEYVISDPEPEPPAPPPNTVDVFALMMATQRQSKCLPPPYPELKLNRKIQLKNDILKWCQRNELGWMADGLDQGRHFVSSLANVFWDLDGHRDTLHNRGCGIPIMFDEFVNYNVPEKAKHRKRAHSNLDKQKLEEFSQLIFDLCSKGYMKKDSWKAVRESLLRMADNLRKYSSYLEKQVDVTNAVHSRKSARTDVDEWEIYPAKLVITPTKAARYKTLHNAILHAEPYTPKLLNEFAPTDRRRRMEYLNDLVFPCKVVRYSYTGSSSHLHFIWSVNTSHTETQLLQQNNNIKETIKKDLPRFHTRSMRRDFIASFGTTTGVKVGVLREAYRRLTGDASAASYLSEAEVDIRIREIIDHEDPDLIWDLRITNSGRLEEYHDFLVKCQEFVANKLETAVDDRRHDPVDDEGQAVTHLAMAISVRDLHDQVKAECEEGIKIPSVQWLRLQFWPSRTSAAARKNTGRVKVKMMVSARQFRKQHVDAYYASAIFRYEKEFAVKFREITSFICQDDKHTVKVGEPGFPVSAVERGKGVIVGLNERMEVGDHDFTKFSLSPSVSFKVSVPEEVDGSFYTGRVYVGLKENCFEPSSAARHASELNKTLKEEGSNKPVECHYHDGGPDHNIRYPRTQLVQLAYFLERDLDQLILVQTPPHHSWKNPAERIMSNLNLGLQGVGVVRKKMPTMEEQIKSANNMKAIREIAKNQPKLKEEVKDSIEQPKILLGNVFSRLQLKGENFKVFTAASRDDMIGLVENVKKIDEDFDCTILLDSSKPCKPTKKVKDFMAKHCVSGHYQLSVKKCGSNDCVCGTPRTSPDMFAELYHLPFPVPKQGKYQHFEDLYGKEDTNVEKHVPSKLQRAAQKHRMPFPPSSNKASNVKMVVQCEECLKWRVCYAARVLKRDQKQQLEHELDTLSYSCGACFQDIDTDGDDDSIFKYVYVNDKLTCDMPIEAAYFVTFNDPLCYYCGSEHNLEVNDNQNPLCDICKTSGKQPHRKNTRAFVPRLD